MMGFGRADLARKDSTFSRVFNLFVAFLFLCLSVVAINGAVTAPAFADPVSGTTDWLFPHAVRSPYNYVNPDNALNRDGQVATNNVCCGLLTVHDFTPVDLPAGAMIDKVEMRFHLAGVRTTARFQQYTPSFIDCVDSQHPGYYKDFAPTSETALDDYIVEYTSQDCRIDPNNVRIGDYNIEIVRFLGWDANYIIDDISARFTYTVTPPPVSVSPPSGIVGTVFAARYSCSDAPVTSVERTDGAPPDGAIIDLAVTADRINYVQSVELDRPGTYRIRIACGGTSLRSDPVVATLPPQECQAAALIGIRGSGDNQHDGYDFDYPGAHALAIAKALDTLWGIQLYDADGKQDRAIGLSYPAVPVLSPEVVNYSNSVSRGVDSLLTEIGSIRSRCGALHPILLVGFSQGAHVIQDTLTRLDNAADQGDRAWRAIAGVALFGSPRFDPTDPAARGTFAANYPANGVLGAAKIPNRFAPLTHTYCVVNDIVCQTIGTIGDHTGGYPADSDIVRDATGLLAHTVRARSGGVASPIPEATYTPTSANHSSVPGCH